MRPLDERVAIGLSGFVSLGGRDLARLDVTLGAASFEAQLPRGGLLRVGPARYEVHALDKAQRRVRLLPRVPYAGQPLALPLDLAAGQARALAAQAFYSLPDGSLLALGNVLEVEGQPAVNASLFPPGYEDDPMQDHARAYRARAGAALGPGRLREIAPGAQGAFGTVTFSR